MGVSRAGRRRGAGYAPARSEISEQTTLGNAYVRALMRSQLRAGVLAVGALVGVLGPLPLVFALTRAGSGPGVWLVLGLLAYPVMWLIARWYVRRAERNEADFTGLVADPAERA
ncbi:hypothetical protein [Streptomyces sp. NPDC047014]|uniref:hypothetical protein n=1 Tax=Streptomyces sp. NPDC047014 TaxID=3155736 RepID=UPI0033D4A52A